MNIGEYRTVREGNFKDFDKGVNALLEEGFQPWGNPYLTDSDENEFLVCQAMVREKPGTARMVPVGGI